MLSSCVSSYCARLALHRLISAFPCRQQCSHRIKLDAAEISQLHALDVAHSRAKQSGGPNFSLERSAKTCQVFSLGPAVPGNHVPLYVPSPS